MLYFSIIGYIFTKKGTDTGTQVYSHSTTLIRKNLRTLKPKIPHSITQKLSTYMYAVNPTFTQFSISPLNPHIPTKKYHPTKRKVTFLQIINFSALKPSTTISYLKSHNLYILKTDICHYTLQGTISTNPLITTPAQV